MSDKAKLKHLIDLAIADFGVAGVIDLSLGTGMTHIGLASIDLFDEDDCGDLLNATICQWMSNVGATDADIVTAISHDCEKPTPLGVLKRFEQAKVLHIIRTALGI